MVDTDLAVVLPVLGLVAESWCVLVDSCTWMGWPLMDLVALYMLDSVAVAFVDKRMGWPLMDLVVVYTLDSVAVAFHMFEGICLGWVDPGYPGSWSLMLLPSLYLRLAQPSDHEKQLQDRLDLEHLLTTEEWQSCHFLSCLWGPTGSTLPTTPEAKTQVLLALSKEKLQCCQLLHDETRDTKQCFSIHVHGLLADETEMEDARQSVSCHHHLHEMG